MDNVGRPFPDVVDRERARSERYNHYFAILLIRSEQLALESVLRRVESSFRISDTFGIVSPDGRYRAIDRAVKDDPITGFNGETEDQRCSVGVILPETNRGGAKAALRRFGSMITAEDQVQMGMAVYPRDSTNAVRLIETARGNG